MLVLSSLLFDKTGTYALLPPCSTASLSSTKRTIASFATMTRSARSRNGGKRSATGAGGSGSRRGSGVRAIVKPTRLHPKPKHGKNARA
jgi:hypothetical protein